MKSRVSRVLGIQTAKLQKLQPTLKLFLAIKNVVLFPRNRDGLVPSTRDEKLFHVNFGEAFFNSGQTILFIIKTTHSNDSRLLG